MEEYLKRKNTHILHRARPISPGTRGDGPVVYWMERDLRIRDNWALLYAQQEALARKKPLCVLIVLPPHVLAGVRVQDIYLLSGLTELQEQALELNIYLHITSGDAVECISAFTEQVLCHQLVTDFHPLNRKRRIHDQLVSRVKAPFVEVDTHNIVPAWLASPKKEYGAYTIRPKIQRLLPDYLIDIPQPVPHPFPMLPVLPVEFPYLTADIGKYLHLGTGGFQPGEANGRRRLRDFVKQGLSTYAENRNNPNLTGQSELSPYLHFGQLSPQRVAYAIVNSDSDAHSRAVFLEELIIRRELADNFCLYEPNYDKIQGFHPWAQKTLQEHAVDSRAYIYSLADFERAETHEPLWNACQMDLATTNKLHGFLRMYWAKKILEWSASPSEALSIANTLNDKYSIDGCDPNGYTGVAWSIGGVHDRAWQERPIFGKIRYMNERGCRRKFKVDEYISACPHTSGP